MILIAQCVTEASCVVDKKLINSIDKGYMVLVGIGNDDNETTCEKMAKKLSKLRVFEDEDGKMNLDIHNINGKVLSISQFTLYGDASKGNRPSFIDARNGEEAKNLYEYFNDCLRKEGIDVYEGVFGAHMEINLNNDGPKTFILRG